MVYGSIRRSIKSAFEIFQDKAFLVLFFSVLFILGAGMIFYHNVEGWSYIDALYFSVTTLTTIGYGDHVPHSDLSKIFTMVFIIIGIGIMLAFINVIAKHAIEKGPGKQFMDKLDEERKKMKDKEFR
ncbi:Calcium-gated potassium channel MthK [Candidatus Gugararchaeum adminiculabundum]|nr:Calcium-gated potassium channel MthK [Candidatus Gugararchaeum adminiculabundum]